MVSPFRELFCKEQVTNNETNGNANGDINEHTYGHTNGDQKAPEPPMKVAIIGMGCRLPGDVSSPEEFWELISRARSGFSPIPKDRWNHEAFQHPNPGKSGTYNPVGGHFLSEDLSLFDAPFFNITEAEAISMDPQQRLMLECTYEALENGGIPKGALAGKDVGVFIGSSFVEYEINNMRDTETVPMYQATGCASSLQAARLSYYFDFRGPATTLDTACSSSLVALHSAMQSLQSGDSTHAVVGGCHLNMFPDNSISMSMQRLFSDEGRSFAFDNRGSGYGRGEGVGCIILKPLDQAIKDHDVIRAVISGTGVNQDGRTKGITMPSSEAQVKLMRSVYAKAGLDVADTGYVEAHGTGTKVGDPIEASALRDVFGKGRTPKQPLLIGSVKSNIGHLEGASGVVAIIKAALMLEKGFVVPNYNFEKVNEGIPLADWNLKVATTQRPWPRGKKYISINNFGFGGTNAHAVLERAPPPKPYSGTYGSNTAKARTGVRRLYVLSANDKSSAEKLMENITYYLEQRPAIFENSLMGNLAYTLGERRSHLPWKVAVASSASHELIPVLASQSVVPTRSALEPKIGFIFTGQGAQWHAMGRELMDAYPVFASTMKQIDSYLADFGADFSLIHELSLDKDSSRVSEAHISQPACTAIQLALTNLFFSWDIRPNAVSGHSSGEIGAAYAAGMLDLKDSIAIAYHRGQAITLLKKKFPEVKGAMMAVGGSPEEVRPLIKSLKSGKATIACINSPSSITASGDDSAITELHDLIEEKQMFNRKLRVDVAYHSHHMSLVGEEYVSMIKDVKSQPASGVSFFSSLRGKLIDGSDIGPEYWRDNLTSPVRFSEAVTEMCTPTEKTSSKPNMDILIEIGPHSALEGPVKQILKAIGGNATKIPYASSLVRNVNAINSTLDLAATLFMKGVDLNTKAINFPTTEDKAPMLLSDMPRYPWYHGKGYWHHSRISEKHLQRDGPRNDILGTIADYSNELEPTWRNVISIDDMPWLRQHKMSSLTVYPIAGYMAMAIEAASRRATARNVKFDSFELREISASRALVIDEGASVETNITLRAHAEGTRNSSDTWDEFRVFSWSRSQGWLEHCRGLVAVHQSNENGIDGLRQTQEAASSLKGEIASMNEKCTTAVDSHEMYDVLTKAGAEYGTLFRGLENVRASDKHAIADLVVPDMASTMPFGHQPELIIHPAFLDHFIQTVFPVLGAGRIPFETLYMPSFVKSMSISCNVPRDVGKELTVYTSGNPSPSDPAPTNLSLFALDPSGGEPLIQMESLTMTPVSTGSALADTTTRDLCYKLEWEPVASKDEQNGVESLTNGSSVAINGTSTPPSGPDLNIVIIYDKSTHGSIIKDLASSLSKITGRTPEIGSLEDIDANGKICIFLTELAKPFLANLSSENFNSLQKVLVSAQGILWVVKGAYTDSTSPDSNMVVGLARTLRSETLLNFTTFDLDQSKPLTDRQAAMSITDVFNRSFAASDSSSSSTDREYMERDGEIFVPRFVDDSDMNKFVHQETQESAPDLQLFAQEDRPLKMKIKTPGALDTLYFDDDAAAGTPLGDFQVEINVKATSMNFKDIMIAMGQLANPYLGIECSGVITAVGSKVKDLVVGDRVCAMSEGAYSTYTRCLGTSAQKIADDLSFEIAATIPVIFCTTYYSLFDLAHLRKGERVLIHAAAGGVGQAAIQLAQIIGAEIFATVGSASKKELLMTEYQIPESHIFYSRDTSFAKGIRRATNDEGVDVVLNSLAGDQLRETWDCLAHFGRFIEIGKRDITGNTRLEMARFEHNALFASVDLTIVAQERPRMMKRILEDVFGLLEEKKIREIAPITSFPISEVESAFRTLQGGKIMGKVVIVPNADDQVKAVHRKTRSDLLKADATYIVIGGTGGLGRSMAKWMVGKGAKNIVLISRSATISPKVAELAQECSEVGATIKVYACDVTDASQVEKLVTTGVSGMPVICGVIHGAMVLHDTLFEKMSHNDWDAVVQPKVAGAWNFHNALLATRTPLDFFIALSSVSGSVGNRGQAAYAAANTFLNAFVQYRLALGMPACSIDLSAVSNVGYLADNAERQAEVAANLGGETVDEPEVLALLAAGISGRAPGAHVVTGIKIGPKTKEMFWVEDAKFSRLRAAAAAAEEQDVGTAAVTVSLRSALKAAANYEEALKIIYDGLVAKVSAVLMLEDEMDPSKPIVVYGLDSLVAIEIRNWITRELEANLQVLVLLTSSSIVNLAETILKASKLVSFTAEGEENKE